MAMTGERDRSIDLQEDVDLGDAVLNATEQHGKGVIGGVQKDQPAADEQEAELAGDQSEEDGLEVDDDEEAAEEADRVSEVSDEEAGDGEDDEADAIDEGEDLEDEDDEVEEEDEEDLTPRDETGRFEKKFTSVDPNKLPAELKPLYKSMQADYTRKGQELSQMRGELESRMAEYQEFVEELGTDDGVIRLGVELAQRRPETFAKMLDMVQRLQEDEREREYWQRDQELRARERRSRLQARQEAARQRQEITTRVTDMARKVARQYGIPFQSLEAYLDNAIAIHRQRNEGRISVRDVEEILQDYVAPYRETAVQEQRKRARKKAKQKAKAKSGKPKLPAGSPGSSTSRRRKEPEYGSLDDAVEKMIFGSDFDIG